MIFIGEASVCVSHRDTSLVVLPNDFMRVHNVVSVPTVSQKKTKCTKREDLAVVLAKQFRECKGLIPLYTKRECYMEQVIG